MILAVGKQKTNLGRFSIEMHIELFVLIIFGSPLRRAEHKIQRSTDRPTTTISFCRLRRCTIRCMLIE